MADPDNPGFVWPPPGGGDVCCAPVVFQPIQFSPIGPATPYDLLGACFPAGGPNVPIAIPSRDADDAVTIETYKQSGTGSIAYVVGSLFILRGIVGIPDSVRFDVDVSLATDSSVYGIVLRNPCGCAIYAGWLQACPPA